MKRPGGSVLSQWTILPGVLLAFSGCCDTPPSASTPAPSVAQAAEVPPRNAEELIEDGKRAWLELDFETARECFKQAVAADPENAEYQVWLDRSRLDLNRPMPGFDTVLSAINAFVLAVDRDKLRISAGSRQGVAVGYTFVVYRGSQYVSKLVVECVADDVSVCRELRDFQKDPIRPGDIVTTNNFR